MGLRTQYVALELLCYKSSKTDQKCLHQIKGFLYSGKPASNTVLQFVFCLNNSVYISLQGESRNRVTFTRKVREPN